MAIAFHTGSGVLRVTICAAFVCLGASAPAFAASAAVPEAPKKPALSVLSQDALFATLPQPGEDIALRFVVATGAVKNLSLLLLDDVKHNAGVQAAIKQYGMVHVQNAVVKAIRATQREYANDWSALLAEIYRDHLSDEELDDILSNRTSSRHFVKLLEQQDAIAADLSDRGHLIFTRALQDVLRILETALPT